MKKLFSFIRNFSVVTLVLIMALAPIQIVAFGAQEKNNITHIYGYAQNPIHFSNLNQNSSEESKAAANVLLEPALTVKNNMVARNERFTVKISTKRTDFQALVSEIFKLAVSEELAETSVEGDYLAWHYGGYSFSGSVSSNNGTYECTFDFKVSYYTTAQQEQEVTTAVQNALEELDIEDLKDHDKCKAIYDFVCQVCNYDYSNTPNNYTKFSAYGAIVNGMAVCQGYSTLLYRMLKEAGLNNKIVTSPGHSWNIVQINGLYYNTDATWDDNYYDKGLDYEYFLNCDTHFQGHDREEQYCTEEFLKNHEFAQECYYDTYPEDFISIELGKARNAVVVPVVQVNEAPAAIEPVVPTAPAVPPAPTVPPAPAVQNNTTTVCTNHQYAMTSATNNTCTADGYQYYRCTVCGAENTVVIPAKGHTVVIDEAVMATYAGDGLTQGSHCADCQLVIAPQNKVPKLTLKATAIKKVKAEKKGFTVEWQKQKDATGYEVQYSTTNKFIAKNTKTVTVNKNGTDDKKIADLKGNTKYYIRVRAYKIVNGKKYYSSWTTVKNVKTKK